MGLTKVAGKPQPTIVGANHLAVTFFGMEAGKDPKNLQECIKSSKVVSNLFESLARQGVKRTLFIEGAKQSFRIKKFNNGAGKQRFVISAKNEPFLAAFRAAAKNGWNIVTLDSRIRLQKDFYTFGTAESRLFHNMNIREDAWAKILRKEASPNDVVFVHSGHVGGILLNTGWNAKKVIWVNRPSKEDLTRRLTRKRLVVLKNNIEQELARAKNKKPEHVFGEQSFGGAMLKKIQRRL